MTAPRKGQTDKTARNRRTTKVASANRRSPTGKTTKLDLIVALLSRPKGASLAELGTATGWQPHSVRGALAGALKKKGHVVTSEKTDGQRRYRIGSGGGKRG
jgi:Protein of unknown function (DUF3489)